MFAKDDPESAQRSDDGRRELGINILMVAALLARQSLPTHRQQRILSNSICTHETVGNSGDDRVLLERLVVGVSLPASITSHCLPLRFLSSKISSR